MNGHVWSVNLGALRDATTIWSRKQQRNETVGAYCDAMRRLAANLTMADGMLQFAILQGLLPHIKSVVIQQPYQTLDDMMTIAKRAELAHTTVQPDNALLETVLTEIRASKLLSEKQQAAVGKLQDDLNVMVAQASYQPRQQRQNNITRHRPVAPHPVNGYVAGNRYSSNGQPPGNPNSFNRTVFRGPSGQMQQSSTYNYLLFYVSHITFCQLPGLLAN